MIKVCVPYVRGRGIDKETQEALIALDKSKFEIVACEGLHNSVQRNAMINNLTSDMVCQELDPKYSHYVMTDSDIVLSDSILNKLLSHDLDVVSGAYESRRYPGHYEAGFWGIPVGNMGGKIPVSTKGLIEVGHCGLGACLIKAEVLNTIKYPWIEPFTLYHEGHASIVTDDIAFSTKCYHYGVKIFVDCDCIVKHLI
jgi:hypothetical protein